MIQVRKHHMSFFEERQPGASECHPQSFTETTRSKTNSKSFWKMVCWKTMFFLGFDPIFNAFLLLVLGNGPSFFMKHSEDWNLDDIRNCDWAGIKTSAGFSDQNPGYVLILLYGILLPNYLPIIPKILKSWWFVDFLALYGILITTQLYTQTLNDVWHIICPHLVVFYGKCIGTYTIHGKFGIGCFNKPI